MKTLIVIVSLLFIPHYLFAQNSDQSDLEAEIEQITNDEQNAFVSGDCEALMEIFAEDVTFFANGMKINDRSRIRGFCESMPRPFPGKPKSENLEIHILTPTSAYTVKTMELIGKNEVHNKETITKIWVKLDGKWRMQHLHSTVTPLKV